VHKVLPLLRLVSWMVGSREAVVYRGAEKWAMVVQGWLGLRRCLWRQPRAAWRGHLERDGCEGRGSAHGASQRRSTYGGERLHTGAEPKGANDCLGGSAAGSEMGALLCGATL